MVILTFFLILPVYSFEVMEVTFTYSTEVEMYQNSDFFSEFEINRLGSPLIQCATVCAQSGMCYGVELCNTTPKYCRLWGEEFRNNGSHPVHVATKCSRYTKKIRRINGCSHSCDCFESTGVHNVTVNGKFMEVNCFRETYMWTVIQRRLGGSVLFNRNWSSYKNGFGSPTSEFWLGNDNIHLLTKEGLTYLRVDLMDFGEWKSTEYSNFSVDTEENKYKLAISGYSGDGGYDMTYHHGMNFSTPDVDNDDVDTASIASQYQAGWWFRDGYGLILNGEYPLVDLPINFVAEVRMMIRRP